MTIGKLPIPTEVSDLHFLRSDTLPPGYAVLELETGANPIRVQLEALVKHARITLAKIDSHERIRLAGLDDGLGF
jgi:hypothetical protein